MRFIRWALRFLTMICCVMGQIESQKRNVRHDRRASIQRGDQGQAVTFLADDTMRVHQPRNLRYGHTWRKGSKGKGGGKGSKGSKGGGYRSKGSKGGKGKGKGAYKNTHGNYSGGHKYHGNHHHRPRPSYTSPKQSPSSYQPSPSIFHRAWYFIVNGPTPTDPIPPPPSTSPTPAPISAAPPTNTPPTPFPPPGPTPSPTSSPTCNKKELDVCVAIDRSGSICTPAGEPFISCKDNPDCGCDNFDSVRKFTNDIIENTSTVTETLWAVISYASTARVETSLASPTDAMSTVEEFRYAGGWTSTGPALELCRNELADSVGERTIILLTDGTPTRPDSEGSGAPYTEATDYATEQADSAKEDDITVITVYVNTATGTSSYLESLASPGNFIEVNDFDNLDEVQQRLLRLVQCS